MESNDRDQEPVFAAALLANRSKASRSPRGSTRSSLGKSPLSSVGESLLDHLYRASTNPCPESSADSSPAESENSSPTGSSSKTTVIISLTSTNFPVGGQIELRSPAVAYAPALEIHPGHRVNQMPVEKSQPERKYFGHNKPPTSEVKEAPAPAPVMVKKERFSFLKRGNSSVAAH